MRITINQIKEMKQKGEKIPMLTAYDYLTAKIVDRAGIPLILIGDSLGMVMLGYDSTIPVTMADMIHHTRAVVRGAQKALIVADMPFMSFQASDTDAMYNAGRLIQEGGAQAVKLEGGVVVEGLVKRMVDCGIPVMGHIGLTPQSVHQLGGYKVQGKTREAAQRLLKDAEALDRAGAFVIILECIPAPLSRLITERVSVPTIGIGAGVGCDGQVQVVSDMLGLDPDFVPKHAKQYTHLSTVADEALKGFISEVQAGSFPTMKQSYVMDEGLLEGL
jgi:3-methyl-2-oxobutanoate hydroxymethyltransferase